MFKCTHRKGAGDEAGPGELWLADLNSSTTRAMTPGRSYRSPIFVAGNREVLVLQGTDVLRLPLDGGEGKKLFAIQGIWKLVAASSKDPDSVLILLREAEASRPTVALVRLNTGAVVIVPYDPTSPQDLQMLEDLQGWSRTYGDRRIYVGRENKETRSGTLEWNDVFLQVEHQPAMDVSRCDGAECGQPSLSPDGQWLVFIKSKAEY